MVAPAPRCIVNIAPLILTARSLSRMPKAVAVSQWGTRWWSGNDAGILMGPVIVGFSWSPAPSTASGCGVFGMRSKMSRSDSVSWSNSATSACSASPSERLWAIKASAASFSPERLSAPTCFESSFTLARVVSRSVVISRNLASRVSASCSCTRSSGLCRRANKARTISGSFRKSRTSITENSL